MRGRRVHNALTEPLGTRCFFLYSILPRPIRDRDAWALLSFAVELCEHFVRNFGGDFEFSGVELMLRL
jgi:hypothetical protein